MRILNEAVRGPQRRQYDLRLLGDHTLTCVLVGSWNNHIVAVEMFRYARVVNNLTIRSQEMCEKN